MKLVDLSMQRIPTNQNHNYGSIISFALYLTPNQIMFDKDHNKATCLIELKYQSVKQSVWKAEIFGPTESSSTQLPNHETTKFTVSFNSDEKDLEPLIGDIVNITISCHPYQETHSFQYTNQDWRKITHD